MPNALLLAAGLLLLAAVFLIGRYMGSEARDAVWQRRWDARPMFEPLTTLEAEPVADREVRAVGDEIRAATYARAAFAVATFPSRIDRRAELVRHLLSLVDAPELGVSAPNPEPASEVEASSASPVSSAAPVLVVPLGADAPLGFESGAEGRIDPMEGFL